MSLKRVIEIWTPEVEEKPGFELCPEHLIPKGVRVEPSSRTYRTPGKLSISVNEGYSIISRTMELRSSTVPGRTEHADICELDFTQCAMSSANWGKSKDYLRSWAMVPT